MSVLVAPTLRTATRTDAEAIRALTRAAYAKWVPIIGREPRPMSADYEALVQSDRIDLLYDGDALAGLIHMAVKDDHLLIENVAVAPDRQGQGLGRRLLAHAEDVAAHHGLGVMRLYTNKMMEPNVQLYLNVGYRIDSEEKVAGGALVHMSKRIGS